MASPSDINDLPAADESYTDSDWTVGALGNVRLVGYSDAVYISGEGTSTEVILTSNTSVSTYCGTAVFSVTAADEGAVGTIGLSAGDLGSVQLNAGVPELGSSLVAKPETLTLSVGPPEVGASISMTPESINLSVGPPGVGASISMTPESITLKVGEVILTLSLEGIVEDVAECTRELTPEGHNFTAAETEYNIGVAGFVGEGPTSETEIEAASEVNATLANVTTDGVKAEEAALLTVE